MFSMKRMTRIMIDGGDLIEQLSFDTAGVSLRTRVVSDSATVALYVHNDYMTWDEVRRRFPEAVTGHPPIPRPWRNFTEEQISMIQFQAVARKLGFTYDDY